MNYVDIKNKKNILYTCLYILNNFFSIQSFIFIQQFNNEIYQTYMIV